MQFDPAGTEIGKPWTLDRSCAFPPRNCCDLERLFLLDADWEGGGRRGRQGGIVWQTDDRGNITAWQFSCKKLRGFTRFAAFRFALSSLPTSRWTNVNLSRQRTKNWRSLHENMHCPEVNCNDLQVKVTAYTPHLRYLHTASSVLDPDPHSEFIWFSRSVFRFLVRIEIQESKVSNKKKI